ncbi:MAG: hypothetical protein AAFX44_19900, partial [Pseudomonadota bacterium]
IGGIYRVNWWAQGIILPGCICRGCRIVGHVATLPPGFHLRNGLGYDRDEAPCLSPSNRGR